MNSFWNRLVDLVSPRACCACGKRLGMDEQFVCAGCMMKFTQTSCAGDFSCNEVTELFDGYEPIERGAALYYYSMQSAFAHLIYNMKYGHQPEVAIFLAAIVVNKLQPEHFFDGIDLLVPVPLTPERERQRGYNQCVLLARAISDMIGVPVGETVLKRVSFAGSQTHRSMQEREQNVAHAFTLVDAEAVQGRHVLLIDDVITTGATMRACASELQQVEGVKVSVLSLGLTFFGR